MLNEEKNPLLVTDRDSFQELITEKINNYNNQPFMIFGPPGSGKTYKICQLATENRNILLSSPNSLPMADELRSQGFEPLEIDSNADNNNKQYTKTEINTITQNYLAYLASKDKAEEDEWMAISTLPVSFDKGSGQNVTDKEIKSTAANLKKTDKSIEDELKLSRDNIIESQNTINEFIKNPKVYDLQKVANTFDKVQNIQKSLAKLSDSYTVIKTLKQMTKTLLSKKDLLNQVTSLRNKNLYKDNFTNLIKHYISNNKLDSLTQEIQSTFTKQNKSENLKQIEEVVNKIIPVFKLENGQNKALEKIASNNSSKKIVIDEFHLLTESQIKSVQEMYKNNQLIYATATDTKEERGKIFKAHQINEAKQEDCVIQLAPRDFFNEKQYSIGLLPLSLNEKRELDIKKIAELSKNYILENVGKNITLSTTDNKKNRYQSIIFSNNINLAKEICDKVNSNTNTIYQDQETRKITREIFKKDAANNNNIKHTTKQEYINFIQSQEKYINNLGKQTTDKQLIDAKQARIDNLTQAFYKMACLTDGNDAKNIQNIDYSFLNVIKSLLDKIQTSTDQTLEYNEAIFQDNVNTNKGKILFSDVPEVIRNAIKDCKDLKGACQAIATKIIEKTPQVLYTENKKSIASFLFDNGAITALIPVNVQEYETGYNNMNIGTAIDLKFDDQVFSITMQNFNEKEKELFNKLLQKIQTGADISLNEISKDEEINKLFPSDNDDKIATYSKILSAIIATDLSRRNKEFEATIQKSFRAGRDMQNGENVTFISHNLIPQLDLLTSKSILQYINTANFKPNKIEKFKHKIGYILSKLSKENGLNTTNESINKSLLNRIKSEFLPRILNSKFASYYLAGKIDKIDNNIIDEKSKYVLLDNIIFLIQSAITTDHNTKEQKKYDKLLDLIKNGLDAVMETGAKILSNRATNHDGNNKIKIQAEEIQRINDTLKDVDTQSIAIKDGKLPEIAKMLTKKIKIQDINKKSINNQKLEQNNSTNETIKEEFATNQIESLDNQNASKESTKLNNNSNISEPIPQSTISQPNLFNLNNTYKSIKLENPTVSQIEFLDNQNAPKESTKLNNNTNISEPIPQSTISPPNLFNLHNTYKSINLENQTVNQIEFLNNQNASKESTKLNNNTNIPESISQSVNGFMINGSEKLQLSTQEKPSIDMTKAGYTINQEIQENIVPLTNNKNNPNTLKDGDLKNEISNFVKELSIQENIEKDDINNILTASKIPEELLQELPNKIKAVVTKVIGDKILKNNDNRLTESDFKNIKQDLLDSLKQFLPKETHPENINKTLSDTLKTLLPQISNDVIDKIKNIPEIRDYQQEDYINNNKDFDIDKAIKQIDKELPEESKKIDILKIIKKILSIIFIIPLIIGKVCKLIREISKNTNEMKQNMLQTMQMINDTKGHKSNTSTLHLATKAKNDAIIRNHKPTKTLNNIYNKHLPHVL